MIDPNVDTVVYLGEESFADLFFSEDLTQLHVEVAGKTDIGRVRKKNEDHFAVFKMRRQIEMITTSLNPDDLRLPDDHAYSLVVADGMGGMQSGELASRLAVQTMMGLAGHATSWVMKLRDRSAQQIDERVEAYVQRIQQTMDERSRVDPAAERMGTTWTSAHLIGRNALIVHLGDSRAYRFRGGQLQQITKDQTMAQMFIDLGSDPEDVARFGNVLMNNFGSSSSETRALVYQVDIEAGDRLLLCTDGLTDMLTDEQITQFLVQQTDPQFAVDALVEAALEAGGKDNVTVVVADLAD